MGKLDYYNYQMRELPLVNVEAKLAGYHRKLCRELYAKGLRFPFHIWVSDEWFCPDGVPGIAMPFYLFQSDLLKIEEKQMGFVEGKTERERMRLLRHELGHCIDNAFRLRKNKQRQKVFGSSEQEYPDSYSPQVYSKNYVHYLGDNYAQSHPDEDFAETFAVWLDPEVDWHGKNENTLAYKKLKFMDDLMTSLRNQRAQLKNQFRVEPIEKNRLTLSDHYKLKRKRMGAPHQERLDRELRHFFLHANEEKNQVPVSKYIGKERKKLCQLIAQRTGSYQYQVNYVITKTIERAKVMRLKGTKVQLQSKAPLLIERNFRYLKEKQQLKYYL